MCAATGRGKVSVEAVAVGRRQDLDVYKRALENLGCRPRSLGRLLAAFSCPQSVDSIAQASLTASYVDRCFHRDGPSLPSMPGSPEPPKSLSDEGLDQRPPYALHLPSMEPQ